MQHFEKCKFNDKCSECNIRFMDDINTEHNMKSICRAAVAQWTKCLTRNGQTRVRNWKGANILLSHKVYNKFHNDILKINTLKANNLHTILIRIYSQYYPQNP